MAGVEDGEVQGTTAVKKGGLNLDTRARFGRRGAGITTGTRRGVARPGMAEKKGVTGGATASVGGDWDAGDARERAERLTGWPALSVGDARARRGLRGTLGCGGAEARGGPDAWRGAGRGKGRWAGPRVEGQRATRRLLGQGVWAALGEGRVWRGKGWNRLGCFLVLGCYGLGLGAGF